MRKYALWTKVTLHWISLLGILILGYVKLSTVSILGGGGVSCLFQHFCFPIIQPRWCSFMNTSFANVIRCMLLISSAYATLCVILFANILVPFSYFFWLIAVLLLCLSPVVILPGSASWFGIQICTLVPFFNLELWPIIPLWSLLEAYFLQWNQIDQWWMKWLLLLLCGR